MVGVDSEMASSVLRLWIAAGSAAVLVAICAVAFTGLRTNAARAGVVALGALVGVAMMWALLGSPIAQDHGADRRALEMRAQELTARTLAPGSALACLDAVAGENVDAACEKALFASAATVAAATSYAAARLELLSDMAAYVKHGGRDIDGALLPLRHSLETDAYGFVAHALAVRDGCTSQNCKALEVLRDASRVGAAARWPGRRRRAAEPADIPAGRAGPAQDGQHRLPHRGIDPASEHHESGARHQTRACGSGGVCGQSKSASINCRNCIGAAVEETAQAGRQSAGASSTTGRRANARGGGRATRPGVDASPSGAACASSGDGSRTGSELRLRRSRAAQPLRVAAISSIRYR
jgi:hypothetical protein